MNPIKETVQQKYGEAALRVVSGGANSCCGASACCGTDIDPITTNLDRKSTRLNSSH